MHCIMRLIGLNATDTVRLLEAEREETCQVENPAGDPTSKKKENMAVPRRKILRFIKAMIFISVLGTLFIIVRVHFFNEDKSSMFHFSFFSGPRKYMIGDVVKFQLKDKVLSFTDAASGNLLKVKFQGNVLNTAPDLDSCDKIFAYKKSHNKTGLEKDIDPYAGSICLKWKNTVLVVSDTKSTGSQCYSVQWTSTTENSTPANCFALSSAHWYGGSLFHTHQWPLEKMAVSMEPYVSSPLNDFDSRRKFGRFGPVLERMWFNSAGFGIVGNSDDPLHVSINAEDTAGQLCLQSALRGKMYRFTRGSSPLSLTYSVCMDRSAKYVHQHLMKNFFTLPTTQPHPALMQNPVWSTRGVNLNNMTESQMLTHLISISKYNFLHSQFHIGGNYTRSVGSLYFDERRFPHSFQMVNQMNSVHHFNVTTSILPLVEHGSILFEDGIQKGVFVNASLGQVHCLDWRKRLSVVVDFTNPKACSWLSEKMAEFKAEAGVKAFFFESGEAMLLWGANQTAVPLPNACDFSTHYAKFAHSFGSTTIISVGYRSQQFGLMVDLGLRVASWEHDLGLKSLIPAVLTSGLLGYPFVLVGPVGGIRVHTFDRDRNQMLLPDQDLFIRWLQLSSFLPGLEMSVGPWQYDRNVIDLAHQILKNRAERVVPVLETAAKEFLLTGAPIIRPLWWMATDDEIAQRIDCEFMVSNKILVAPVLDSGAVHRSVYLPKVKGIKWQDDLRGHVYDGGQWIHGYKVAMHEVATFRPVSKGEAAFHAHHHR